MPEKDVALPEAAMTLDAPARTIGFLLVEGYALLSFAAAVEPLRAANVLAGRTLYAWRIIAAPGPEVIASNQARLRVDHAVGDAVPLDALLVCMGGNPALYRHPVTEAWLRRLARQGVTLGGISGGPYLLARAGLLQGRRCTVHWEHAAAFREEFPDVDLRTTLFEIDRDRLTCAGGSAALDMMHAVIEADHGTDLANAVNDWFLQSSVRRGQDAQRGGSHHRLRTRHPKLLAVLRHLDQRLDEPASAAALAARVGLSPRQLQRLFATHLGTSVERYLLGLRLDRARELVRQSGLSVMAVAVATGFASASHFSRAYKARFGASPSAERRVIGGLAAAASG